MSVVLRASPLKFMRSARRLGFASVAAAIALGGCSASISRFDNASFALGEGSGNAATRRASVATTPDRPVLPPAEPARASSPVEMAGLPAVESRPPPQPAAPAPAPAKSAAPARPAQAAQSAAAPSAGQQIEVQSGDTLYGIAKRHKVMISDLMAVNDLKSPNLKPGQKLFLPGSASVRSTPQVKPERAAATKPAPAASQPATAPAQAEARVGEAAAAGDTYTVKPGDSLFAIAARYKIKTADLQRANNITNVGKVRPGTVLKIPAVGGGPVAAAPASEGETVQPETRIVRIAGAGSAATQGVKVLNSDAAAPAAEPAVEPRAATQATPAAAPAQTGKLRWPAKGRVVQAFGPRADGSHNDGVDIAVPAGTDVLAAEGGVVAYAGNEVKTYGNLVLIRHDNGWVTAYANNEKLLVQRGDRVKRGQPVAKAGKSGSADQPQVHFEVRVGSRPVDPVGYLENL